MTYGFGAFFGLLPGGDISSIMLIYGFPISLLGFALAYAQLKPVPCKTTKAAFDLRESQMTDIQKQVWPMSSLTREVHLPPDVQVLNNHLKADLTQRVCEQAPQTQACGC